ncbi:hypothetical protein BO79DRAFT_250453 [Aspergillus costaricaensis CBS 115574]|uniref:Uncharacterized protein n=1 Tax=Aspergillus costaricaensis CBS 115574 TaxID=1448317 RepID=A0ACD1IT03_9EURO|nr:hypothetical protein BO79DRAFT_250453 [Aspergillus costaricaensis CBS 115574]RAK93829.1 hypothetical protein BO79DRAFT_250453 [Aspergillus costaricaensis CBS 115574]
MAIFLGGSQLCAAAPNVDVLAVRVFQGLGGSGMIWAVGSAVGPVLGGVSVTKLSWRWCFWINLPIGDLDFAVLLLYLHVPNPRKPRTTGLKAIDWTGILLIVGPVVMILLALDLGDVIYPWSSATMGFVRSLVTAIAVVVGGVVFQAKTTAANGALPHRLCGDNALAREFDGDLAASNVEKISGLEESEQVAVRGTCFRALRMVWVMYVTFAWLALVVTLFVRAHNLRKEKEGALLGVERVTRDGRRRDPEVGMQDICDCRETV